MIETIALCVMAASGVAMSITLIIRTIQAEQQLQMLKDDTTKRQEVVNRAFDDLRKDNREWLRDTLKEYEELYGDE